MITGRVEAFSDGVLAIAITLLILEVKVPEVQGPDGLTHALADQWPSYATYLVTFAIIGRVGGERGRGVCAAGTRAGPDLKRIGARSELATAAASRAAVNHDGLRR